MIHRFVRRALGLAGLTVVLAACGGQAASSPVSSPVQQSDVDSFKVLIATQTGSGSPGHAALSSEVRGAKVNVGDIERGCYHQDCIPSIDHPRFESVSVAGSWLHGSDVVFGLHFRGIDRAYPQRILNWHEVVNDTIGGSPVVVTFCPLCGSALAFKREVNGKPDRFGVSGLLYNSDLIMYDGREGSLWQQFNGQAIVGPAAQRNERLQMLPVTTTTWRQWKQAHTQTQVLSRNTGFVRDYGSYPYGTYEQDNELYFGVKHTDKRLPLKTVVYGVVIRGSAKAYRVDTLRRVGVITDTVGGERLLIRNSRSGEVRVTDEASGHAVLPLRTFWFAWAAFYPGTALY